MNRIDRLFGILTLLQSRRYVPVDMIAEKFGISIRTVYRDMRALTELGIPIGCEPHKGYFVVQGYFLPPVSLTTEEANALLLMEPFARPFADKSIQIHYSNALSKVKAVLRSVQKEKLELLHEQIRFQVPASLNHDFEYLSVLQQAVSARHMIEMEYKSKKEEVSSREVEPLGLIFYAFSWHLIAWCHMRNDYRDFKVSRILKIRSLDIPFRKQDHIDLSDYMKELPVDY